MISIGDPFVLVDKLYQVITVSPAVPDEATLPQIKSADVSGHEFHDWDYFILWQVDNTTYKFPWPYDWDGFERTNTDEYYSRVNDGAGVVLFKRIL